MNKKKLIGIFAAVIIIVLAVVVVFVVKSHKNTEEINDPNYEAIQEEDITFETVDITTMAEALVNNESQAQEAYNSRYIETTGTISEVDPNNNYIILACVSDNEAVAETQFVCYFSTDEQRTATYNVGDTVTLSGKVIGVAQLTGYAITVTNLN